MGCFNLIIQLLPHSESKEEYRGKTEDSLGWVLAQPYMEAKNQHKLTSANQATLLGKKPNLPKQ